MPDVDSQSYFPVISPTAHSSPYWSLPTDRRTQLKQTAKGTFTVEMKPQGDADVMNGVTTGRMSLNKKFDGDLTANGSGVMLTAMTPVKGSAGYVAIERVIGTLNGKEGSFVFQHSGIMDRGTQQLSVTVVPGSGTGELTGIDGKFTIIIAEGKHSYEFEYFLP